MTCMLCEAARASDRDFLCPQHRVLVDSLPQPRAFIDLAQVHTNERTQAAIAHAQSVTMHNPAPHA